ncbi:MAG: hypothetical protein ABI813_12540 [Bacteroidota bacterium]
MHEKACFWAVFFALFLVNLPVHSQQSAREIAYPAAPGGLIGFLEFRPTDYGSQRHPLIIFLHGSDERGNGRSQLNLVTTHGIPRYCANGASMKFTVGGQTSSFVVLSPQLSTQYGVWPVFYVKEMIRYAKQNLQIDSNRVYVSGLSLGGGGVWAAITESDSLTDLIAAAAPVCGTQEMNDANFCRTVGATHLPVWAFHAMDDKTVNVAATQHGEILGNICKLSPALKITYYLSGGHQRAWINAYDTGHITVKIKDGSLFKARPNLYEWLLGYTRVAAASGTTSNSSGAAGKLALSNATRHSGGGLPGWLKKLKFRFDLLTKAAMLPYAGPRW